MTSSSLDFVTHGLRILTRTLDGQAQKMVKKKAHAHAQVLIKANTTIHTSDPQTTATIAEEVLTEYLILLSSALPLDS